MLYIPIQHPDKEFSSPDSPKTCIVGVHTGEEELIHSQHNSIIKQFIKLFNADEP